VVALLDSIPVHLEVLAPAAGHIQPENVDLKTGSGDRPRADGECVRRVIAARRDHDFGRGGERGRESDGEGIHARAPVPTAAVPNWTRDCRVPPSPARMPPTTSSLAEGVAVRCRHSQSVPGQGGPLFAILVVPSSPPAQP